MRYLGIDFGTKKIGLALSDETGSMGFPHAVISNTPRVVEEIAALIAKQEVGAIVIGESKNFKGDENKIAQAARSLGEEISLRTALPIFYEPEALTSAEARRQHDRREKTRAPKVRATVDASAAALILTSYLSRTHHG